jgi:hypothetical protein
MVSAQPLPNLVPALSEETRPQLVLMLVSENMHDKAVLLRQNFEKLGCRVEETRISPYQIEAIRSCISEVLARHEGRTVALNLTCGTKLMALGAYEVFRDLGYSAFYIDTDNRRHISLLPTLDTRPLAGLLSVKMSLSAFGYAITHTSSCQVSPKRGQFGDYLVTNIDRLSGALGILNACAARAKTGMLAQLEPRQLGNKSLQELLAQCAAAELLVCDGARLVFKNEDARFFANGGWLEEYVLRVVNRLKGQKLVQDHACNLRVESQRLVRNEIDLALTAHNRLHLIECKTAQLEGKKNKTGRADTVAYKLEALRDLVGGTYARAMLVSYRPLTNEDRQRCRDYKIELVETRQIQDLEGRLTRWIG